MSKENACEYPPVKTGSASGKRQGPQELKEQLTTTNNADQNQLTKKIKNKLRMKKRCSNNSGRGGTAKTPPDLCNVIQQRGRELGSELKGEAPTSKTSMNYSLTDALDRVLERDANVLTKLERAKMDLESVRDQLIKNSTFIQCEVGKGKRVEEAIMGRILSMIENQKLKQKIQEREKNIMAMMDKRIQLLNVMEKRLVS